MVLDASVLIAHFSAEDAHHDAATQLLAVHHREQFLLSAITLAEFLVGPARVGQADEARRGLEALAVRTVGVAGPDAAWRLADLRVRTGLKLPDCCVLDVARHHDDARLATFDARLLAAADRLAIPTAGPAATR